MIKKTKKISYNILSKVESSKDICSRVSEMNSKKIKCLNYDGGSIFVKTSFSEYDTKVKLEKTLKISLGILK